MLKRLLASIAIVSLLLGCAFLVYWWRAHTGHSDHLTLGSTASTESHFTTDRDGAGHAIIIVEVRENRKDGIVDQIHPYRFKEFLGYFLIIPGLWVAIKVRSLLPRPGRSRDAEL